MPISPLLTSILLACWAELLWAIETRVYDFNIGWVVRNPDGRHERRVIAINDEWPPPTIEATIGDQIIVNVFNGLEDRPTSLHFHGLFQNGTNQMDGAIGATQCPIPPGMTLTYNFTIEQPGTYWYHSHELGQYPEGLRAPLIVHDPKNPFRNLYHDELVLTLSDWYHSEMSELANDFLSVTNPTGAEPVPQSALQNDTQNLLIPVQPGETYFLRIINIGAFANQYFWVEGHTLQIVELDGVYHEPVEVEQLFLTPAQRVGVLLTTKNDKTQNYAIVGAMDVELFDMIPDDLIPNTTSYLVYNPEIELPIPSLVDTFEPYDDFNLVPIDHQELYSSPATSMTLEVVMDNLGDGANYAFFNNITYKTPLVPTLYTVLSANGSYLNEPAIYGSHTNTFILEQDRVIEIVLNNKDDGKHPFHLHGHNFQLIARSEDDAGPWDPTSNVTFPRIPMRRDTVLLPGNGYLIIRFRSDNPGVWLFHCHIEWHMMQGLIMTLVEAPSTISQTLEYSESHSRACKAAGIPIAGNAAGNNVDWLDLTGQPSPPDPLPDGFTTKGVLALAFSIATGIIGTVIIVWYSYGDHPGEDSQCEEEEAEADEEDADRPSESYNETERLLHS